MSYTLYCPKCGAQIGSGHLQERQDASEMTTAFIQGLASPPVPYEEIQRLQAQHEQQQQ